MRRYTAPALAFALGLVLGALLMVLLRGDRASLPALIDGERLRAHVVIEYHRPFAEVVDRYGKALAATPTVEYPRFAVSSVVNGMEVQVVGEDMGGKTVVYMSFKK